MLRINRQTDENGLTILRLEGRLTADLVIVLNEAVAAAGSTSSDTRPDQALAAAESRSSDTLADQAVAAEPPPSTCLALDLTDLSYVDQAGITALRRLVEGGHAIARSPDWIRLLLTQPPHTG